MGQANPEIELLLRILEESFRKKAWHGPNLRGSVRGILADQAGWRPAHGRKSIADVVLHCAYWKYAVRRRLRGDKRGSFAITGSNWFRLPARISENEWRQFVSLLESEHRALIDVVAALPPNELHRTPPNSKVSNSTLISGIAAHDVYHAGQIQLLKRLYPK